MSTQSTDKTFFAEPVHIVGVLLAHAVIRMRNSQDLLDNRTEESVSTGCTDYQGESL